MGSSQHKSPHQARAFRRGHDVVTSAEISPFRRTSSTESREGIQDGMSLRYLVKRDLDAFNSLRCFYINQENKGLLCYHHKCLSALFEYLCYGSAAIINILLLQDADDFMRQNLMSPDVRF